MQPVRITYEAPPVLSEFLDSDAFVRAVMGPVGSGKSSACVLEVLRRAKEQAPGPDGIRRTRFAVIRNTYSQLRDTTRKTFEQWIPPAIGKWHEQSMTFRIRKGDIDCEVLFRALDRPEDVAKLLSLELTGAYVNEAREISKHIFDVLQTRVGRYPSKLQGGPTWFGIWLDSNPWHTGHWASKLFRAHPEGHELFRQPGGRSTEAENLENLPPGYYERLCHGKDSEWVSVYVDGEEARSDVGSIWGALVDGLERRGGISEFAVAEVPEVFTNWDLGGAGAKGDATAIWFWTINAKGFPDVIDYYEANGKPLSHYFDLLDTKAKECGYVYAKHWLPHDARAKSLQTGMSTLEQCAERWGHEFVAVVPQMTLADSIQAARWLLEQPMRIHSWCADGIEMLREYRYEWREAERCFSNSPLHNFASHGADAFRYLAVVARNTELFMRKPEEKAVNVNDDSHLTLDFQWTQHLKSKRSGGRI